MLIKGKTFNHKVYELNIDENLTIKEIKNKFSEVLDNKIIDYDYKIIHLGRFLEDDAIISKDYDSKLFIIMTTKKNTINNIDKNQELPTLKQNNSTSIFDLVDKYLNNKDIELDKNYHEEDDKEDDADLEADDEEADDEHLEADDEEAYDENLPISQQYHDDNQWDWNNPGDAYIENDNNVDNDDDNDDDENLPVLQPNNNNNELIGNYNYQEIDDINNITAMGFDYYEVLQIYNASGKNKELAINILMNST